MMRHRATPTARLAGTLLLIVAALNGALVALPGPAVSAPFRLGVIVVLASLAAGVARGILWVVWAAFIATLAGIASAVAGLAAPGLAPDWAFVALLACNSLAAALLFGAIWAGPRRRTA